MNTANAKEFNSSANLNQISNNQVSLLIIPESSKIFISNIPPEFFDQVNESPYTFKNSLRQFFITELQTKLKQARFNLDTINEVLEKLVCMNLAMLTNLKDYHENLNEFTSVVKMLRNIMTKIGQIPKNSILRVNKRQLLSEIYSKVYYSLKNLIHGIITQQLQQESLRKYHHKRVRLIQQQIQEHTNATNKPQNLIAIEKLKIQNDDYKEQMHPLECCIQEISELLESFYAVYRDCEEEIAIKNLDRATTNSPTYLKYFSTLWYMTSLIRCPHHTRSLFSFLHGQLRTFQSFQLDMVEILIQILSNFVHNESEKNDEDKERAIRYEDRLIEATLSVFQSCLMEYDFSTAALESITKTINHAVLRRKELYKKIIKSNIFLCFIKIIQESQKKLLDVAKYHIQNKTPHAAFLKQVEKMNFTSSQRLQIYSFLSALFSIVELDDFETIKIIQVSQKQLKSIIYFEFSKIVAIDTKKENKALTAAFEMEPAKDKEKLINNVLFMVFNLFSFSPEIIEKFLEENVMLYFLGIGQHFSLLEEGLMKYSHIDNNSERLEQIKNIQFGLVSAIWNILAQFRFPGDSDLMDNASCKDRSQALETMIEYKQFGVVKMLINNLKKIAYDIDNPATNKQALKFVLLSFSRIMKFILYSQNQRALCQCLSESSTPIETAEEMISRIEKYEQTLPREICEMLTKCQTLVDLIIKNANFNEGYHFYDQNYQERRYEMQQNMNSEHNYVQNQGNWNNNQENTRNYNDSSEGQSNWNQNQGNWDQEPSEDIQI